MMAERRMAGELSETRRENSRVQQKTPILLTVQTFGVNTHDDIFITTPLFAPRNMQLFI